MSTVVESFVENFKRPAYLVERLTGFPAKALLAQAALETGWGRYIKGNNLYGIKDLSWIEGSQEFVTHEYIDGKKVKLKDRFELFECPIESMIALVLLLRDSPRYKKAYQKAMEGDIDGYFEELQKAGYATDPEYAEKLKKIARMIEAVREG